jgi:cellulose biosynthesis protein BcsQ
MEWASRRGDLPPEVSGANPASIGKEIERAKGEGYNLVLVDTAPHADHAALQAALAADLVAIPCRPSTFDIAAISATLDLCELANKQPSLSSTQRRSALASRSKPRRRLRRRAPRSRRSSSGSGSRFSTV